MQYKRIDELFSLNTSLPDNTHVTDRHAYKSTQTSIQRALGTHRQAHTQTRTFARTHACTYTSWLRMATLVGHQTATVVSVADSYSSVSSRQKQAMADSYSSVSSRQKQAMADSYSSVSSRQKQAMADSYSSVSSRQKQAMADSYSNRQLNINRQLQWQTFTVADSYSGRHLQ